MADDRRAVGYGFFVALMLTVGQVLAGIGLAVAGGNKLKLWPPNGFFIGAAITAAITLILGIAFLVGGRKLPRYSATVSDYRDGTKYLTLARSDGGDMGYPVPRVYGPRRWGSYRNRDRGEPRDVKRAAEGSVKHAFPDHFERFDGPRPEQPGAYKVCWSVSPHARPEIRAGFKTKTIVKKRFRITDADNLAAQKAVTPDTYSVDVRLDPPMVRLRVLRDRDRSELNEEHTMLVIDPSGTNHYTPCKTGEFVYPDEFQVDRPAADAPPSPPLIAGPYYFEGQRCRFRTWRNPDGTLASETLREPFARGYIEFENSL